jgi:hypothetical protein
MGRMALIPATAIPKKATLAQGGFFAFATLIFHKLF